MGRLDGKVALITGGGGAIGGAQAHLLPARARASWSQICSSPRLRQVASRLGDRGLAVGLDVAALGPVGRGRCGGRAEFGPVSILCNNAGANVRVGFEAQTEEMWHLIVDTILTGSFLGIQAVVPSMRRAGGGVIVNLGSLASIRPGGGSPAYAPPRWAWSA